MPFNAIVNTFELRPLALQSRKRQMLTTLSGPSSRILTQELPEETVSGATDCVFGGLLVSRQWT